jgi:hypothetical protein
LNLINNHLKASEKLISLLGIHVRGGVGRGKGGGGGGGRWEGEGGREGGKGKPANHPHPQHVLLVETGIGFPCKVYLSGSTVVLPM